jgi:phosphoenolpyruvate carboxykinase (GTP)
MHKEGVLRRDPMAMLPFCGYNMGDYFKHWLSIGKKLSHPPKIYSVNWFRTDDNGKFIWPGFGENIRVLKWIIERVNNRVSAKETALGLIPNLEDLNVEGLDIPEDKLKKLFEINNSEWQAETKDIEKFFNQFGKHTPAEIWQEYKTLSERCSI